MCHGMNCKTGIACQSAFVIEMVLQESNAWKQKYQMMVKSTSIATNYNLIFEEV